MSYRTGIPALALIAASWVVAESAVAAPAGKLGFQVVRMEPLGSYPAYAAETFGGAMNVALALPVAPEYLAFDFGAEFLNFNRADIRFQDPISGLPFEQSTSQSYLRAFAGLEAGWFRGPLVQPFVAAHLGVAEHNVRPVVSVPDDPALEDEVMLGIDDGAKWTFMYDVAIGAQVALFEHVGLDAGVKFLQSSAFDVRRGQEFVSEDPSYFQIFVGVVYDFGLTRSIE